MLLAAVCARGCSAAERALAGAPDSYGKPEFLVRGERAVIAAWQSLPATRRIGEVGAVHGHVELGESVDTPVSTASLREATGDFALFSLEDNGVLLASGRAGGQRPIFVAWPSSDLVIASTRLEPLLSLLASRPALDADYLRSCLLGRPPAPSATPYSTIRRVPLDEAWVIRPGADPERSSTAKPLREPEQRDDRELAERLRVAMKGAVRRAVGTSTRVAVEVSGGLDSSTVFALCAGMARTSEVPSMPEGFTCEFEAPPWADDRPYVQSLERHGSIRIRRVGADEGAAFALEPMALDAMPVPSPTYLGMHALVTAARAGGAELLLTGDGGDQLLDGDPGQFGRAALRGDVRGAVAGALRLRGPIRDGAMGRAARFLAWPLLAPLLPERIVAAIDRVRNPPPPWAGRAARGLPSGVGRATPWTSTDSVAERYTRLLHLPCFARWPLGRLQEEVFAGYAIRAPLLDDDFLRFVATIPPVALLRGGYVRGLMREAICGLVPDDLRLRETKGDWAPFVEQAILRAGGWSAYGKLLEVERLADLGLVEPRPFRRALHDATVRPELASYEALWRVLALESFLRQYDERPWSKAA